MQDSVEAIISNHNPAAHPDAADTTAQCSLVNRDPGQKVPLVINVSSTTGRREALNHFPMGGPKPFFRKHGKRRGTQDFYAEEFFRFALPSRNNRANPAVKPHQ